MENPTLDNSLPVHTDEEIPSPPISTNIPAAVPTTASPETSVTKSWVDIRAEGNDDIASISSSESMLKNKENEEKNQEEKNKTSSLSPLLVEHPENTHSTNNNNKTTSEEDNMLLASPLSAHELLMHSDSSSGESFDVSDAFDTLSTVRRSSAEQGIRQKETCDTPSPASSVGQLSEDEDPIENTRRGRSTSINSRKRRAPLPLMGQGYFAAPQASGSTVTNIPPAISHCASRSALPASSPLTSSCHFSASSPALILSPPPSSSSSSSSSASSTSSFLTEGEKSLSYLPCALPAQFAPVLQAINARAVSMSVISFLAGIVVAYWWLKRQASMKKTDRLQTEASLRQMLALKEAEVNRLSNLFEKYLSRPLLLRYLPNRF